MRPESDLIRFLRQRRTIGDWAMVFALGVLFGTLLFVGAAR